MLTDIGGWPGVLADAFGGLEWVKGSENPEMGIGGVGTERQR